MIFKVPSNPNHCMICTKKKIPPSCTDARAVGSIFLVISGESPNSIYCPFATRTWQGMPSSQPGCSGQTEDRCGAVLWEQLPKSI